MSDSLTPVPLNMCVSFSGMTCSAALFQFDYMPAPKSVVQMEVSSSPPQLIRPGTQSSVAEIYVPQGAPGYLSTSVTVKFLANFPKDSLGKPIVESEVPLIVADRTAPVISGSATAAKRGGMLNVSVSLQVSDDRDPQPAVTLVSVTSNEPLHPQDVAATIGADTRTLQLKRSKGRLYYLTYRATDGSDNPSSVTITVPGELP